VYSQRVFSISRLGDLAGSAALKNLRMFRYESQITNAPKPAIRE